jgi:predicted secreted protein
MAENAGHLVVVGIHTALGGPYTEISGVTSVSLSRERDVLDITHFKDATAHKIKMMGLKDTKLDISGNLDLADSAQSQIRSRYDDGASTFVQIKWDGSGGSGADGEFKVASYSESAEVSGVVEFSAALEGTPNTGASAVWG